MSPFLVVERHDSLLMQRVTMSILNKQSDINDIGWSSAFRVWRENNN